MATVVDGLCCAQPETVSGVVVQRWGPIVPDFKNRGIETFVVDEITRSPANLKRLNVVLRSTDILNIHCCYFCPAAHSFARIFRIPKVVTLHWRTRLPHLRCPIICVSTETARIQREDNHCFVILNGVDLKTFAYSHKQFKSPVIVIRVCRPEKCAPYFWNAMASVLESETAELWIVGEKGRSTEKIKYFGQQQNIQRYLAKAHIFGYTPFPRAGAHDLVVLEAMAMGVVPVVADVPCIEDSVIHRKNGLRIPFGDAHGFARNVRHLCANHRFRENLSLGATLAVQERFDIRGVAAKYIEVYRNILEGNAPYRGFTRRHPVSAK